MTNPPSFASHMQDGARLHQSGQPEQALVCFERALALQPADTQAASACATLLSELGQPQAAYQVLLRVEVQLLQDADGATNLAIAAEACGQTAHAATAYTRALTLNPANTRALNNTAMLLAARGDFNGAVERMQRCLVLAPQDPVAHSNLADMLIAARRFAEAAALLQTALSRFPASDALRARQIVCQAFSGDIDEAQAAIAALSPARLDYLSDFLARANTARTHPAGSFPARRPDAYDLFCQQAFEAMQVCDWRDQERVTAVLREMLARASRTGRVRDWRDAQFYALMLPLHEDEVFHLRRVSMDGIGQQLTAPMPAFQGRRTPHSDGRIHIGFATQNLRDPRIAGALQRQLQLHDRAQFALHLYSPTPQPDPEVTARITALGVPVVEIAHMTNDEAVGRIRLDGLDIFIDTAFNSPWCRPEIVERRVAPLQTRQITWHRHHPARQCDYNMSDTFVHPPESDMEPYGPVIRLPRTCWLVCDGDVHAATDTNRAALGLPESALVLCCLVPPVMVDPQSFAAWMKILKGLPHAVFWLGWYSPLARTNLANAATAAGLDPARLHYMPPGNRPQTLANIAVADLFVDTLRFNANHGLVDALRMGVPAISCAGNSMASRLGGSILRAAGLPQCVMGSVAALVAQTVRLGNDPPALADLRMLLQQHRPAAALFDAAARVREWEAAWTMMVKRQRAGLAPAPFDVPEQTGSTPLFRA